MENVQRRQKTKLTLQSIIIHVNILPVSASDTGVVYVQGKVRFARQANGCTD